MGLNEYYSQSSNQILNMLPIPFINRAYSMIISEESRRSVCQISQIVELTEGTTLFSSKIIGVPNNCTGLFSGKGNAIYHAQEASNDTGNSQAVTATNFAGSSQEQYQQIIQLLGKGNEANRTSTQRVSSIINTNVCFHTLHGDMWGPCRVPIYDGKNYFLTLVDEYSRYGWIFLFPTKAEVIVALRSFFLMIQNGYSASVKIFRSDNGSEFLNSQVAELLGSKRNIHQTSYIYTPQQNGVAERRLRYILDVGRSLIFQAVVPLRFWGECITTAVYIINRLPSIVRKSDKFAPRAIPDVFLGYCMTQTSYKMYGIHSMTFTVSRDVVFKEDVFPFNYAHTTPSIFPVLDLTSVILSSPKNKSSSQHFQLIPCSNSSPGDEIPLQTQTMSLTAEGRLCCYPISTGVSYDNISASFGSILAAYSFIVELKTFAEANKDLK
ncbi:uncharacterized protein [Nicotiana sylvestris]|uniref:uncharacterized protein n=1 Tax=Nicotiana sylvestris TaxID=4096 RepID=UPI00388CCAE0